MRILSEFFVYYKPRRSFVVLVGVAKCVGDWRHGKKQTRIIAHNLLSISRMDEKHTVIWKKADQAQNSHQINERRLVPERNGRKIKEPGNHMTLPPVNEILHSFLFFFLLTKPFPYSRSSFSAAPLLYSSSTYNTFSSTILLDRHGLLRW